MAAMGSGTATKVGYVDMRQSEKKGEVKKK